MTTTTPALTPRAPAADVAGAGPAAAGRPARRVPPLIVGLVLWSTVGLLVVARQAVVPHAAALDTFGIIFASIVVEALPFVALGAVVAALLSVYVPDGAFATFGRLPRALQIPTAALAGVAFPVCECGSVPVGRRLLGRGVQPAAAVAFMVAAPLVNPLVVVSTWVAYGGGRRAAGMVLARCGFGLVVAVAVGLFTARRGALDPRAGTAGRDHGHDHAFATAVARGRGFAEHLVGDLLYMGQFLVLGAALSALMQTVLPQDALAQVAGNAILAPLALMALAFVLCLCSEADAFVAVSFVAFPRYAQLAFLLLGPVADIKLSAMYTAAFGRGFTPRVLLVAVPLIGLGCLAFAAVGG